MSWILNKKTGIITECHNNDVIKICKKDRENYDVGDTVEDVEKIAAKETLEDSGSEKALKVMTVPELKLLAKEKGIDSVDSLKKEELLAVLEGK